MKGLYQFTALYQNNKKEIYIMKKVFVIAGSALLAALTLGAVVYRTHRR